MPKKYFHIVTCPLSKRQRFLYEDYIGRRNTREQLASGSFLSMMGVLMQLRKVCNHPDLFETRPITTPFICDAITIRVPKMVYQLERGVVFSHSLNHFCEQTDLTDEALESADWRRSLLIFPSFCRRVCLVNDERLVDREEDSLVAAIMRTSATSGILCPRDPYSTEDVFSQFSSDRRGREHCVPLPILLFPLQSFPCS